jgi:hypothetical protein
VKHDNDAPRCDVCGDLMVLAPGIDFYCERPGCEAAKFEKLFRDKALWHVPTEEPEENRDWIEFDASDAVREAMVACQHTPEEWIAMSPELAEFKHKIFGILEMRTLNLKRRPKEDVSRETR